MKITRDNYEIYFLDYMESNLDESLVDEFIEFLNQNPDLKEELQLFECVTVPHEEIEFSGKQKLYKTEIGSSAVDDQKVIAWLEGDLDPEESKSFEEWMNMHPENRKTADQYLSTKLVADLSIEYPQKSKLYRQPSIRAWFTMASRVAAILLVALAIWGLWPDDLSELGVDQVVVQTIPEPEATIVPEVINETEKNESLTENPERIFSDNTFTDNQKIISESASKLPDRILEAGSVVEQRETIDLETLQPKEVLLASVESEPVLAEINLKTTDIQHDEFTGDLPVQEKITSRLGVNNFTFSKLVKSGLQVASNISNSKISYETGPAGEIVALSLDTRVLGLHIPVGKE